MQVVLKDKTFVVEKMSAMQQFHILRRMLPLLKGVDSKSGDNALSSILDGLGSLSDSDSEYILYGLLKHVKIQESNTLCDVCSGSTLMYQNLELPDLLNLAFNVIKHNLSGFLAALPSDFKNLASKASAQ